MMWVIGDLAIRLACFLWAIVLAGVTSLIDRYSIQAWLYFRHNLQHSKGPWLVYNTIPEVVLSFIVIIVSFMVIILLFEGLLILFALWPTRIKEHVQIIA